MRLQLLFATTVLLAAAEIVAATESPSSSASSSLHLEPRKSQFLVRTVVAQQQQPAKRISSPSSSSDDDYGYQNNQPSQASSYSPAPPYYSSSSSPSSAYASDDNTACSSNDECVRLDPNAECRYQKCQCKSPFVSVLMPNVLQMRSPTAISARGAGYSQSSPSSSSSASLGGKLANAIFHAEPASTVKCVPPLQLVKPNSVCVIEQTCCSVEPSSTTSCIVAVDPAVLQAFGNMIPSLTFTLASASAPLIAVNASTGEITLNSTLTSSVSIDATVTVRLATDPAQTTTAQVSIIALTDPCCRRAPQLIQPFGMSQPLDYLFHLQSQALFNVSQYILADFSGNVVPGATGAALSDFFLGPCDSDITLINATLAPNPADTANDLCQYVMLNRMNQLVYQSDPATGDFSATLYAAADAGTLDMRTLVCAVNVAVRGCNGLETAATVTIQVVTDTPTSSGDRKVEFSAAAAKT